MTRPSPAVRREVSAGGVVVRLAHGAPRVLLIRDSYRNWGFPKGHLEQGERADAAALREVAEETGLAGLALVAPLDTIEWRFRFRGRLIHKVCHFFLMRTRQRRTRPQAEEGITACRWLSFDEAESLISYDNAREVLRQARAIWTAAEASREAASTGAPPAAPERPADAPPAGAAEGAVPHAAAAVPSEEDNAAARRRARLRRRNRRRRAARRRRKQAEGDVAAAPPPAGHSTPDSSAG